MRRLARDLPPASSGDLPSRVAALDLAAVRLEDWEEVVDPGGGDASVFIACAREVTELVRDLAAALQLIP